jgi:hypothetical protein
LIRKIETYDEELKQQQQQAAKAEQEQITAQREQEAQLEQSATSRRLQQLEDAMHLLAMTTAKRSRGRKANGYYKIRSVNEIKKVL